MNHGSDGAFVFDVDTPRVVVSDEVLLEGLRRYAAIHGLRPFRVRDFRAWKDRPFEPNTARRRFGTWRKALGLIGISAARASRYSAEELMTNLEEVWRRKGRRPMQGDLQRAKRGGYQAYCRRWGTLKRACQLLAAHKRGEVTREELLAAGPAVRRARRKGISPATRWRVLRRDRYRCQACGVAAGDGPRVRLEVDHIVPVARGGGNEEENLRALCRDCNRGKRDGE